jgi:hypothetical protein
VTGEVAPVLMGKDVVPRAGRNGLENLSLGGRISTTTIATLFRQMATSGALTAGLTRR